MSDELLETGTVTLPVAVDDIETTGESITVVDVPASIAKDLQALVNNGKTPAEAAKERGIQWGTLSKATRTIVTELLKGYQMPADMTREVIRAARNQVMIEGITATGEDELARKKLMLEAAKQAAMDPDIGLNQPPQVAVNIDMRTVTELAKNLDVPEGWTVPEDGD